MYNNDVSRPKYSTIVIYTASYVKWSTAIGNAWTTCSYVIVIVTEIGVIQLTTHAHTLHAHPLFYHGGSTGAGALT